MMTPEIERQLIEWGGVLGMPPLDWIRFALPFGGDLVFERDGKFSVYSGYNYSRGLALWKTLDDIRRVLDVFGVKLKESPKWRVNSRASHIVWGPDDVEISFWKRGGVDNASAAEYAAWMNAKESPPATAKPRTVEEWMAANPKARPEPWSAAYDWSTFALPRKVFDCLPPDRDGDEPDFDGNFSMRYESREAAIAALEEALRKAGELQ